jgi:PPOX class probable F420-dependent enzyme
VAAIPDSARVVLEGPGLAHLVTIGAGGAPQVSCVWVGIEGGEIVFASLGPRRKLDNIRADPRVALSIEGDAHNQLGLRDYLVVHGTARITEGGGPELLQRLAHTYLGADVKFPPMDDPPPGVVVRIAPERFGGSGPWAS